MVILVTGSAGQLGQAIQSISVKQTEIDFVFCDSATLDITDKANCERIFKQYQPDYCINTAAYTAVDQAEKEAEKAYLVNVIGVKNLAEVCLETQTVLVHLSTDFIFDGISDRPYREDDKPNPRSIYGQTKLEGEQVIIRLLKDFYIIRTSWVYSEFGHNFMKTMLQLAQNRQELRVVDDQIGTPTNAVELAGVVIDMIKKKCENYGIYNFSNEGQCSWYEFALEIFRVNNVDIKVDPIASSEFPTLAIRPHYSVLDKQKIKNIFEIVPNSWQRSIPKF
ncbi:dTDP-4-dehydrorhamnose reductase [Flavobacterium sp. HSC-61S13]|uniref:dTDP-4-dehydrorhamnose reductase n=1 Tax=Flavobacterium sp. HSC-61S13 TaxID=2910963 RepID=UPI00209EF37A|nr:dTDP-4-dehydrorhamnose reductase [Flavobacterium sp. HSC-61S13]MCP1995196.1 dTDP-4-dehydrorhamnose reductase [Flavobacterium sp. HSC-61S13]